MALEISLLKYQNQIVNDKLGETLNKIKEPTTNLSLDSKTPSLLKESLNDAKKNQQNNIKAYEKNQKKFKVLKKYGDVLAKIEKLLGLIPSDLANLSFEELAEKLEELQKSRKNNMYQLNLIFYQNMLSDLLTNLVNIEKDFQSGAISSNQALSKVKTAKNDVKEHVDDMPPVLHEPLKQTSELIKLYEESYAKVDEETTSKVSSTLIKTEVKQEHEFLFNKINDRTQEMLAKVNDLGNELSTFEPQVDLTKLASNLKETASILELDNWDTTQMDVAVSDLDRTTTILTDQQIDKNKENDKLTNSIEEASNKITVIHQETIKEVSEEIFKQAVERAEIANENIQEVNEMPDENNIYAVDIKKQFVEAVTAQLDADINVTNVVAIEPESATEFKDDSINELAQDAANNLKERVQQYELDNGMVKILEQDKDDEEDPNNPNNPNFN